MASSNTALLIRNNNLTVTIWLALC